MANQTTLTTLTNRDWKPVFAGPAELGRAQEDIQGSILHNVWLGIGSGASVILCSDCGGKVGFHEYMLRRYTTIFEAFKSDGDFGASCRDGFGNYVFILEGVDWEAVKGLADLLYTGRCEVSTRRASRALRRLLTPEVRDEVYATLSSISTGGSASTVVSPSSLLRLKQERMEDDTFDMNQHVEEVSTPEVLPVIQEVVSLAATATAAAQTSDPEPSREKATAKKIPTPAEPQVASEQAPNVVIPFQRTTQSSPQPLSQTAAEINQVLTRQLRPRRKTTASSPHKHHQPPAKPTAQQRSRHRKNYKPFRCTHCDYRCDQLGSLKVHERTHSGEKPFSCSKCDYKCTSSGRLKEHKRVNHRCGDCSGCLQNNDCGKCFYCKDKVKFGGQNKLKRNCLLRTCQKYPRKKYRKKSKRKNATVVAATAVRGGKPSGGISESDKPSRYTCLECGKVFVTPSKLRRHRFTHSGLRPFQCNVCGKSYSQSANLKTHVRKSHPESVGEPRSEFIEEELVAQ